METLQSILFCFITVANLNLSRSKQNYASSLSSATKLSMDNKNKYERIFGKENVPKPQIYSKIGRRDTSSVKSYMTSLYKYTTEKLCTNETLEADTVVGFANHGYKPRPNASDEEGAMYFDVGSWSDMEIERTLKSELRLYLSTTKKRVFGTFLKVFVYKIVIPRLQDELLTSRIINASTSGWHDFDLLQASQSWRKDESNNHGIHVVCVTMDNKKLPMSECGLIDYRGKTENRPFLVTYYESGDEDEILAERLPTNKKDDSEMAPSRKPVARDRLRRSLDSDTFRRTVQRTFRGSRRRGRNATCLRHELYIRFRDLGWHEWIIQPNGYAAGYCGGECPFPLSDNMNASNHAIIQSLVAMILPSDMPKPCCAPIKLTPQHVLFLDDSNNVVMKRYQNMVVRDCGCQ